MIMLLFTQCVFDISTLADLFIWRFSRKGISWCSHISWSSCGYSKGMRSRSAFILWMFTSIEHKFRLQKLLETWPEHGKTVFKSSRTFSPKSWQQILSDSISPQSKSWHQGIIKLFKMEHWWNPFVSLS